MVLSDGMGVKGARVDGTTTSISGEELGECHGQVTMSFIRLGSGVFRQGYFPNRKST